MYYICFRFFSNKMRKDEALKRLNNLTNMIIRVHDRVSDEWVQFSEKNRIVLFNQKSTKVVDIDEKNLMPIIKQYTSFLNNRIEVTQFDSTDKEFTINNRIKIANSIEEKYDDYLKREEKGKVSINKCFNDLFGIRVIIDCDELTHDDICSEMKKMGLKCEKKDEVHKDYNHRYRATHIYFKRDNRTFEWELQIWRSADEKENQISHKHHRYEYKNWESQTKHQEITTEGEG